MSGIEHNVDTVILENSTKETGKLALVCVSMEFHLIQRFSIEEIKILEKKIFFSQKSRPKKHRTSECGVKAKPSNFSKSNAMSHVLSEPPAPAPT